MQSSSSLRTKTAIFIAGLTAVALVVSVGLAYLEVTRASRAAVEARLQGVAQQLAELTAPTLVTRDTLEHAVAASPEVRRGLRGDSTGVRQALDRLATQADAGLPIELWAADGNRLWSAGPEIPMDPDPTPPLDTVSTHSPFRQVGDRVLYWRTIPVVEGSEIIGWIAQRRRVGDPRTGAAFEGLIGDSVDILIGHQRDSVWVDLSGTIHEVPARSIRLGQANSLARPVGREVVAWAVPVVGSPWIWMAETPLAIVMERPGNFLNRMLVVGLFLLIATAVAGWIGSRRLTRPLDALATAADAVKRGDYTTHVEVEGHDELTRVSEAFNAMADEVARKLEEARAFAERLERVNRAQSDFLNTMSHEVRTPINAVIGYTQLLQAGIPEPPSEGQAGYLERIERSSRHLMALVNNVLDSARVESGLVTVESVPGSPENALRAATTNLEPEANRKGIALSSSCATCDSFMGDQQRVEQVLLNLVSNAVKFTPQGGTVRITCQTDDEGPAGLDRADRWIRFDVEDTGVGVSPDQLTHIFEPFVQAQDRQAREKGGTGLGLTISRRLARLMGGDITVQSVVGEGSTFTLWLRAAVTTESAMV